VTTFDEDDDVPLFSEETFRRYAARLAAKATVQPETDTGMSDDDDDVPVFDGTHAAATVKSATGMSDDDDDVPVIRWNRSNKSS
jgi:hypothetical protein